MKEMNRLADLVERANRKLKAITQEGYPVQFEAVKFTADEYDGVMSVESGTDVIAEGNFEECWAAVWEKVDNVRSEVEAMTGFTAEATPMPEPVRGRNSEPFSSPKREWLSDFDFLVKVVEETIYKANEELMVAVNGGYPFSIEDVVMTVVTDSAGLYVHSGNTPVISISRANAKGMGRVAKSSIWNVVNSTRSTVERRVAQKAEADALEEESGKLTRAAEALKAAGIDTSVLGAGVNLDAAKAIADAAKKAVREANRGVYLYYGDVCDALYGGRKESLLQVRGYSGGVVVLAGGKPCLVTRFPKVENNSTIERTIAFVQADIKAIAESRRKYFQTVKSELEKAQLMHEKAAAIDAANAEIAAAM